MREPPILFSAPMVPASIYRGNRVRRLSLPAALHQRSSLKDRCLDPAWNARFIGSRARKLAGGMGRTRELRQPLKLMAGRFEAHGDEDLTASLINQGQVAPHLRYSRLLPELALAQNRRLHGFPHLETGRLIITGLQLSAGSTYEAICPIYRPFPDNDPEGSPPPGCTVTELSECACNEFEHYDDPVSRMTTIVTAQTWPINPALSGSVAICAAEHCSCALSVVPSPGQGIVRVGEHCGRTGHQRPLSLRHLRFERFFPGGIDGPRSLPPSGIVLNGENGPVRANNQGFCHA